MLVVVVVVEALTLRWCLGVRGGLVTSVLILSLQLMLRHKRGASIGR